MRSVANRDFAFIQTAPGRLFGSLYDLYRKRILPILGGAVTGQRAAYEYLESSAARFPSGADFVAVMRESALFADIFYEPLTLGIAWLYIGVTAANNRR